MKLVIVGVEGVNTSVEVVLDSIPLIGFWLKVILSFFDLLKLFKVLLVVHLLFIAISNKAKDLKR